MSRGHATYARDRVAFEEWLRDRQVWPPKRVREPRPEREYDLERELVVPPGHCPQCSLEYRLARRLTGRREESDKCSLCEIEEGLP